MEEDVVQSSGLTNKN